LAYMQRDTRQFDDESRTGGIFSRDRWNPYGISVVASPTRTRHVDRERATMVLPLTSVAAVNGSVRPAEPIGRNPALGEFD